MTRSLFNHTDRADAVTTVVLNRPCRQMKLAGGVWTASSALVRSRI
jgi:hypothetical protein